MVGQDKVGLGSLVGLECQDTLLNLGILVGPDGQVILVGLESLVIRVLPVQ